MKSKLPQTTDSIFAVMSKMAADYGAINLSQGFPNFESDPKLMELVTIAMKEGHNQYAPMPGNPTLREVISHKTLTLHGRKYNPATEVTVTAGATQAIFTAIAAVVEAGDEVIIFTPAYDCYNPTIRLFGGKTVSVQLEAPYYKVDWDRVASKVSSRTKLIIINTPHNPTGVIWSEEDMLELQRIVTAHDLYVISDEVYEHIIFDGETHQSVAKFAKLGDRSFITASFGKTFHNTGWKLGYCIAPQSMMTEFRKVHQYNVFSVNSAMQQALSIYLQKSENYLGLPDFYQQKRDYFLDLIADSRFKVLPSKGTYFQMLDYSDISNEHDVKFAERLTQEHKLATIPTSVFNANGEDYKQIRVCFAKTEETLKQASDILNKI
ncbi:MAG: methionine aminotransferase [Bacteroidia bacterium]